jgi:hypothetical protein
MFKVTRFFIGFALGLLILELAVRALSPVMGPPLKSWNTMEDAKIHKLESSQESREASIYVMGNSTALIGVNPNYVRNNSLGQLKLFNAAMNGSDLTHISRFATEYLIPKQHPKAIVLFLAPGTTPDLKPLPESKSSPLYSSFLSPKARELLSANLYLFQYRNNLRDPMTFNAIRKSLMHFRAGFGVVNSWADDIDVSGYSVFPVASNSISGGWSKDALNSEEVYGAKLPRLASEELSKILEVAHKHGTRIVISSVPLPYLDNNYRLEVAEFAKVFDLEYISGNDAVTQGQNFADGIHLNESGVKIFSQFLTDELLKLGLG